ncbi:hypothetical protein ACI2OW_15060, partial [Pseudomonas shirazica]
GCGGRAGYGGQVFEPESATMSEFEGLFVGLVHEEASAGDTTFCSLLTLLGRRLPAISYQALASVGEEY